MITYLFTL